MVSLRNPLSFDGVVDESGTPLAAAGEKVLHERDERVGIFKFLSLTTRHSLTLPAPGT